MKNPKSSLLSLALFACLMGSSLIFSLPAKSQTRDRLCETSFRLVGNSETNLVNVWSSPNSDSDLVKALPSGTEVLFNLSNRQGDWAEITMARGITGWVADRFLLPSPAGASQFNGTMRVRTLDRNIAGGVAVNLHALDSGYIMESIPDGAIVTYNESVGYFYDVTTSTGVRGRIFHTFLVCN